MPNVNVLIGFGGYESEVLSLDHLGANMLFHSDRTNENSDFNEVISNSGIQFIRYPGGTISEEYFDITNPNTGVQANILDIISGAEEIRTRAVASLEDFLAYSGEIGARASIVFPTYRFFDPVTGIMRPEAEADIRGFIRDLLTGTYGPTEGMVIELGNEWYQDHFDWTAEQFGYVQATIASWIDDEARDLGVRDTVTLLAQAGRSVEENEMLSSFFNAPGLTTIDGVLTHLYGTNSQGNPLGIGTGINNRLDQINDIWSAVLGSDFELAVTEWNVGENGEDDTQINGLMRLAPLMRIYGEMLSNGVDLAMIWSTQTNGPAGLSGSEGSGSDLSPTGYFYSMLSHSIPGMQLVDTEAGFRLRDESGNSVGYTYTFEENTSIVSYFVSGIGEEISLDVDLTEYIVADTYVYATVLAAAPGESGTEYWAEASIRHITDIDLSSTSAGEWHFEHQLNPYELVELHVVVGEGVTIAGDSQNVIDDTLSGSQYADHLSGNLGDDSLSGAGGDDYLEGGGGNDFLSGENDHDTLEGGQGNDTLLGAHGRDSLDGGSGDDFLDGGNWHDTLIGGEGTDTLLGGAGNDLLYFGDGGGIADGGSGEDTLSFLDASEGVSIWRSEGVVEVGASRVEFAEFEVYQGSQFDDGFSINGDRERYFGEDGNDVFNLLSGSDNLVNMGSGDDLAFVYSNNNSQILGGTGNDRIYTYTGNNSLVGETGDDIFYLNSTGRDELEFRTGDGADQVYGFQSGTDQIEFQGMTESDLQVVENEFGTLLDFGVEGSIFLDGTLGLDLSSDLLFV